MKLHLFFAALTLASGIAHAADGPQGAVSSNAQQGSSAGAQHGKLDKCSDTNDAKCTGTGNTSSDFSTSTQWAEPETYALVLGGVGVLLLLGTRRRREG